MIRIDWNPSDRVLRQFAGALVVFAGILCVSSAMRVGWNAALAVWFLAAAAFSLASFLRPRLARLPFLGLSLVTFPIGYVVSFCLMAVTYYFVVTPIGLCLRLAGRDSLGLRKKADATASFWVACPKSRPPQYYLSQ